MQTPVTEASGLEHPIVQSGMDFVPSHPIRIAIVNRGEAATRFLQTASDLRDLGWDLTAIALHTSADRHDLFVRRADEAYDLDLVAPTTGAAMTSGYLDHGRLVQALGACRADMAWVGWGFVAEDAEFADACRAAGVEFIGPPGDAMRLLADKARAKALATSAGVPVIPWSEGPVESLEQARAQSERIGFPLLVKSSAGGGGLGIREVADAGALQQALDAARQESERAFGDGQVFLERRIDVGRHVEVQVLADATGSVWPVGLRECSIQRRRQKLVEESGLSRPNPELEGRLREYAVRVCEAAGYTNAGTVEFLVDEHGQPFFMEVNARLQVEHTVTEMTTGLDLVAEQIKLALGEPLQGTPPPGNGHAIEVRVNAEDPGDGFRPAPGAVAIFRPPGGPGVRVDSGVVQGDRISKAYDSMITKIIAWGADRPTALARLRRAVDQTDLVIDGGTSNRSFLLEILGHPDLAAGDITTRWLDDLMAQGDIASTTRAEVALLVAALEQFRDRLGSERDHFVDTALRGHPDDASASGPPMSLAFDSSRHTFEVHETRDGWYDVLVDGCHHVRLDLDRVHDRERAIRVAGHGHATYVAASEGGYAVEVDGVPHRISAEDEGIVRASYSGMVVRVDAAVGDEVEAGDVLTVVESMKVENEIVAPTTGRVDELFITSHSHVHAGQVLLRLAPSGAAEAQIAALDFAALASDAAAVAVADPLEQFDALVLGLQISNARLDGLAERLEHQSVQDGLTDREISSLDVLCDIHELSADATLGTMSRADPIGQYLRDPESALGADRALRQRLDAAMRHYEDRAAPGDTHDDERLRLMRVHRSSRRVAAIERLASAVLRRWLGGELPESDTAAAAAVLQRLAAVMEARAAGLSGLARTAESRLSVEPRPHRQEAGSRRLRDELTGVAQPLDAASLTSRLLDLQVHEVAWEAWVPSALASGALAPEVAVACIVASTHRAPITWGDIDSGAGSPILVGSITQHGDQRPIIASLLTGALGEALAKHMARLTGAGPITVELLTADPHLASSAGIPGAELTTITTLPAVDGGRPVSTALRRSDDGWVPEEAPPGLHPAVAERLETWRLGEFELTPEPAPPGIWLFAGGSREDVRDKRLFALAEINDLGVSRDAAGAIVSIAELELTLMRCFNAFRHHDSGFAARSPYGWHRVTIYIDPVWDLPIDALRDAAARVADGARGLSMDQVVIRMRRAAGDDVEDTVVHMIIPPGTGIQIGFKAPSPEKVPTLRGHRRAAAEMRRRGLIHPWAIVRLLTSPGATHSDLPPGDFVELELTNGRLEPTEREPATNPAGVVVGLISNVTAKHPEGMQRVAVLNDPSKGMASLGEAECSRILAALRLAEERGLPVEWLAVSSGARVAMDSGTENLDWTARVLRQIVEMTQRGHEINVLLTGVNVGGQSYWDAEATMLMHTRGILIAVADNAMVLTGKQALDFSGAVSAASNTGIGGYERIMGPNGQAQYWAPRIEEACQLLLRHYDFSYIPPGERTVRQRPTTDPVTRSVGASPQALEGSELTSVGDIFSATHNPDRKKPFDIRSVMAAVADLDDTPLERWADMLDAENAIVWDIHVGGHASTVIGIESHDLPRHSAPAVDGPERWTSGTLFPQSSKKVARAINAASGVRPVVVLANLSGFDGSPESMRELQLEYGSEIGRSVINFRGPLIFVVLSRYHGGAFVVFSKVLNDHLEVIAVEGARASVLGGAPAAAVVFGREVAHRAAGDPRVKTARQELEDAAPSDRQDAENRLAAVEQAVRTELRGALGQEFDSIHTIERARDVGSVDRIVSIDELRPAIVQAIKRGIDPSR